ncbi:hypothetical protein J6590_092233 [Homalodisca vitripennis]|nr:hypothetical protein J6590_092233 [Homalodisca vitripennis]
MAGGGGGRQLTARYVASRRGRARLAVCECAPLDPECDGLLTADIISGPLDSVVTQNQTTATLSLILLLNNTLRLPRQFHHSLSCLHNFPDIISDPLDSVVT